MNGLNLDVAPSVERDLERVIEPLASYICAVERPRAALRSALALLVSEVKAMNRAAVAHVGNFAESN